MSRVKRSEKLNSLFSEDYRVIDFLPYHVAEHGNSIFEEVESYFLQDKQLQEFCDKAIAIILKVICYYPFEVYVEEYPPLKPKRNGWLKEKRCDLLVKILKRVIMKKKGLLWFSADDAPAGRNCGKGSCERVWKDRGNGRSELQTL